MRANRLLTAALMLLVMAGVSCTGNEIDDADGADVVLEIINFDTPAVTAAADPGGGGGCIATVTEWNATVSVEPINSLGGSSPFNDVRMETVDVVYTWDDPAVVTPPRTIGLGGVTIPVTSSGQLTFFPIGSTDLGGANLGQSARMDMVFRGRTVAGTAVTLTVVAQLLVEECA